MNTNAIYYAIKVRMNEIIDGLELEKESTTTIPKGDIQAMIDAAKTIETLNELTFKP